MVGRTERTVINNMVLPLQEMLGNNRVMVNYGQGAVNILGREVKIFGANNEQSRTKIQGLTLAGALVDECSTIPESFFNMLYSRLSVTGAKLFLTANPEGPNHWLKTKWLDKAKLWITRSGEIVINDSPDALDLHRYTFVLEDNPSLDPAYVDRIKRSYTGMWRRRYIDAEWVAADGAVYDMFDPSKHVVPWQDLPRMVEIISLGIDYGTTNPTAATALGLGEDGILYAVNEKRLAAGNAKAKLTDGEQSAALMAWLTDTEFAPDCDLKPRWTIVDPAAASFKLQLARDGAWNLADAYNNVMYGIRIVASGLAGGWLKIADNCKSLINEFPGYSWDPKAEAKGEDKPIKLNDHHLDSLRYAIATTERRWRPTIDSYVRGGKYAAT